MHTTTHPTGRIPPSGISASAARTPAPGWKRPRRHGPLAAFCRRLGRLFAAGPDQHACWCIRCTLLHLGIYRREHIRHARSAYLRTTLFGIRVRRDRYAFPLDRTIP
ncbi:MAG: hypothetical protein OXG04_10315 [Acidobacteria bacterium]|nr:hypothetical protein [Acidobacteriota bacterium]